MFNRPEVLELINEVGDIEHPVPLGMTLLRKVPEFRKLGSESWIQIVICLGGKMVQVKHRIRYPPFESGKLNAEHIPVVEYTFEVDGPVIPPLQVRKYRFMAR